jgi:hypothetical protein
MKIFQLSAIIYTGLTLCRLSAGQAVTPGEQDGKFNFQVVNTFFEVDPSFGARISSFKINDEEVLQGTTGGGDYLWGATLWQSPQSEWNWPPSVELDQDPYTGGIVGTHVILRSSVDETYSHLVFTKDFSAELSDTSITIVYTMINKGTSDHSYSAWEVARVPSGGISFFPMGEGDVTGAFAGQTELINGVVWYEQEAADPSGQKFMCDGTEGWSAHVSDELNVFVKKFEDASATSNAPGEKEIELYYSGPTGYIELENQSVYANIPVDDSVTWKIKCYLRKLPPNIDAQTGNTDLVNCVRGIGVHTPDAINHFITSPVSLYPNPAGEYIWFSLPEANTGAAIRYKVFDITGKLVLEDTSLKNIGKIELCAFREGLYVIRFQCEKSIEVGRFIIYKRNGR